MMEKQSPLPDSPATLPPGFAWAAPETGLRPKYPTAPQESGSQGSSISEQLAPEETNDIADRVPNTPAAASLIDRVPDSPAGIEDFLWQPAFDGNAVTLERLDMWARRIAYDSALSSGQYLRLSLEARLHYALDQTYGVGAWRMTAIVDDQARQSNPLRDLQGSTLGQTHLGTEQVNQSPVFFVDYLPPIREN